MEEKLAELYQRIPQDKGVKMRIPACELLDRLPKLKAQDEKSGVNSRCDGKGEKRRKSQLFMTTK
jgi:hypothetical protein